MKERIKGSQFRRGLRYGLPIGVGYLSVSFSFGIMAVNLGIKWWQAILISMTTLTSAGQLAGINIMIHPGMYIDMLISQITINLRYSFMSVSLSQKVNNKFNWFYRCIFGFFITDEIFAVASNETEISRSFLAGLSVFPYFGWTLGTTLGALLGNVLPGRILSALSLAIYGMFIAIVVPAVKEEKSVGIVVFIAIALSCLFYYMPGLKNVSSGITITICSILAALAGAALFPVEDKEGKEADG